MNHEGLAELERIRDELPPEHRTRLADWMAKYIQRCDIEWTLDRIAAAVARDRAAYISASNGDALRKLALEVASSASVVTCLKGKENDSAAEFRASVVVLAPKAPPPVIQVVR